MAVEVVKHKATRVWIEAVSATWGKLFHLFHDPVNRSRFLQPPHLQVKEGVKYYSNDLNGFIDSQVCLR